MVALLLSNGLFYKGCSILIAAAGPHDSVHYGDCRSNDDTQSKQLGSKIAEIKSWLQNFGDLAET
jgi:hypothetical protein